MALPSQIDDISPLDPLLLLPIPDPLPADPQPDLQLLLDILDATLADPSGLGAKVPMTVLTAHMRQLTRKSQILLNAARLGAAEAREKLDRADVELRGTEYERDRVREEIERCMEYAPAYRELEMLDVESFLAGAEPDVRAALPQPEDESYEYALMTARLEKELADTIQCFKLEEQLAKLTKERDAYIKAKKEIKSKFDAVDVYLTDFQKTTNAVASKIKDVAKVPAPTA